MRVRNSKKAPIRITAKNGVRAAVITLMLALAGCGGGGGGESAPAGVSAVAAPPALQAQSSFSITGDTYGIENATYLAATRSSSGLVLRAAIASSMTDQNFKTVARIDIADPAAVRAGTTYSLAGANPALTPFPGTVYFFNGHASSMLQTTGGTISFTSYGGNPGDLVAGSFSAVVLDGNDSALPKGSYTVSADFSFTTGSFGPILPAPVPVPPTATSLYNANCAACHTLGAHDTVPGSGPELALKGGKLNNLFAAGVAGHKGITLDGAGISALKILLNVN